MKELEVCCDCNEHTGNAGELDDSLYIYPEVGAKIGPLCAACYDGYPTVAKAVINGFDLTDGKDYLILFVYDTVYEVKANTGIYCRNKGFFEEPRKESKTWQGK